MLFDLPAEEWSDVYEVPGTSDSLPINVMNGVTVAGSFVDTDIGSLNNLIINFYSY